jgi:RimJ/RimL family protein N-acetyltransferase
MEVIEPVKFLSGEKVYLRPLEQSDADIMHLDYHNDMEIRRLTGVQRPITLEQIRTYIDKVNSDPNRAQFAICRQDNNEFIGDIALNEIESTFNRSANLRIAIATHHTGQGFGTEAIRLLLDYGFGFRNLHRVELDVYTINPRALKVYEKVGFVQEGVKRKNWYYNHKYYDSIMMSILAEEFRAGMVTND